MGFQASSENQLWMRSLTLQLNFEAIERERFWTPNKLDALSVRLFRSFSRLTESD